jgi:hypothetical protein
VSSLTNDIETARSPYRTLIWFARHGGILTGAVVTLLMAAAVVCMLEGAWQRSVIAVLVALVVGVFMRLLTELLRLLVDTLIPQ